MVISGMGNIFIAFLLNVCDGKYFCEKIRFYYYFCTSIGHFCDYNNAGMERLYKKLNDPKNSTFFFGKFNLKSSLLTSSDYILNSIKFSLA